MQAASSLRPLRGVVWGPCFMRLSSVGSLPLAKNALHSPTSTCYLPSRCISRFYDFTQALWFCFCCCCHCCFFPLTFLFLYTFLCFACIMKKKKISITVNRSYTVSRACANIYHSLYAFVLTVLQQLAVCV